MTLSAPTCPTTWTQPEEEAQAVDLHLTTGRYPDRHQRQHQRQRTSPAAAPRGFLQGSLHRTLRCHRHQQAPRSRRHPLWPHQHGRVRHGLHHGKLGTSEKPLNPHDHQHALPAAHPEARQQRSPRHTAIAALGLGHRGLDPPTRQPLRSGRPEAILRQGITLLASLPSPHRSTKSARSPKT